MMDKHDNGPLFPEKIVDPRTTPFSDAGYRGYLPHLYKDGCSYFVTFCLNDVEEGRRARRRSTVLTDDAFEVASAIEPKVEAGECLLSDARIAQLVEASLLHFQGRRYLLSAWCLMPNHVHAVVTPIVDWGLRQILHSWKSFTAHEINRTIEREGPVWQEESFDHAIRDEEHFGDFVRYTEMNPVAAGFVERPEDWPFSSARFSCRRDEGPH